MRKGKIISRVGLVLGLLAAVPALAEMDSEQVIKYRQNVMKSLGGHMGAMASIVRRKVAFDDQLVVHASAVQDVSRTVLSLFPEGSDFGDTRAKPEVWDKRDAFEKAAQGAERAAVEFAKVAQGGDKDAIGESFKQLSDACKGCHKDFREEKE